MKKDTRISNGSCGGVALAGCSTCRKQEECTCEIYNQALSDLIQSLDKEENI